MRLFRVIVDLKLPHTEETHDTLQQLGVTLVEVAAQEHGLDVGAVDGNVVVQMQGD